MPLQASTTDQLPVGMTNCNPSRRTGIPLNRNALTVKSAVISMNHGMRNSPIGTAKKRKASGKRFCRAARTPNNVGTAATSIATNANWVSEFTAARSPNSHRKAVAATATSQIGQYSGA